MASPALFASVSMALLPHAVPLDARRLHAARPALRCSSPAMLDPASASAAYNSALVTDPLVTKAISAGVIIGAGDAAAQLVEGSKNGDESIDESTLRVYLDKWDKKYWATYKVLDILQKVFYRSNPAREAFVEMCADEYVQKMTFDSYLYKTVVPGNPIDDIKLLGNTVASIVRANALRNAAKAQVPM